MDFSNRINYIELDNDSLFKAMFLDKRCRKMISAVLSRITNISEEKILNAKFIGGSEFPKSHRLEKKKISDIVIEVDDNTVILVEANKSYYKTLFLKNESYAFSTFIRRTHIKDNIYPNVYLVNINSFSRFKKKKIVSHMMVQDNDENKDIFNYHVYNYDIAKTALLSYNEGDEVLIRFAKFMKSKTLGELKEHAKGDERFMFSFDMIEDYVGDDARVVTYDREALHAWEKKQFYNDGIEDGIAQGITQGKKDIINNMLENKMSISEISSILKIPTNEIENLINN